jgi:hypothetical protein
MDINFIDPGGIDQDQPHSQESNAAEDRGDDASETMEEAEGDVNGGGNPEIFNLSEYLDNASLLLSKKDKWDEIKDAVKGEYLDWSQDDKDKRSFKKYPTIKVVWY